MLLPLLVLLIVPIGVSCPTVQTGLDPEASYFASPQRGPEGRFAISNTQDKDWPWDGSNGEQFAAETLAPTMECRWWPKLYYSSLFFDMSYHSLNALNDVFLYVWIQRDQDTAQRSFKFYFDGYSIATYSITSSYKGSVGVPNSKISSGDLHTIRIEGQGLSGVDRGWKLLYIGIGRNTNPPQPLQLNYVPVPLNEYTPYTASTDCAMEYSVVAGESTLLEITTANANDPTTRSIDVYIQDYYGSYIWKKTISTGSLQTADLGSWTDNTIRKMKLVFKNVGTIENAKKITRLSVTYIGCKIEVDYMSQCWSTSTEITPILNSLNDYLKTHAAHRIYWEFSEILTYKQTVTTSDHWDYFYTKFNHVLQNKWEYTIWVDRLDVGGSPAAGNHLWYWFLYTVWDCGIALSHYYGGANPITFMHEYGHHLGFEHCSSYFCVMNSIPAKNYYSHKHWSLRNRW